MPSDGDELEALLARADDIIKESPAKVAELTAQGLMPRDFADASDFLQNAAVGEGTFLPYRLTNFGMAMDIPSILWFYCNECLASMRFQLLVGDVNEESQLSDLPESDPSPWKLHYTCKHCESLKSIFLQVESSKSLGQRWVLKAGEWPTRDVPLPSALLKFAGTTGSLLNKGYRCECLRLGVGAFTYYRRVLEDRTEELVKRIRQVAEESGSSDAVKALLDKSLSERAFGKSLNEAGAVPAQILIDGKNPLDILHNAVSAGLHAFTDAECLDQAAVIREVLELTLARIESLLQEPEKLRKALGKAESHVARASAKKVDPK